MPVNRDSMKNNLLNMLKLLNIAVISGILFGLFFAAIHILSHNYIGYGTYNLVLLSLGKYINQYTLKAILAFIVLLALVVLTRRLIKFCVTKKPTISKIINKRVIVSVLISLIILYIFDEVFRFYYKDIIMYLKGTALNDLLDQITDSRRDTREIYRTVINISGITTFILSAYILFRYRLSERLINALYNIACSRFAPYLGVSLALVLVILNIYLVSYKVLSTPDSPNVILISIDTLRADRLGSYGNPRNTSPNIDKLASQGVLFENAYSQAPWTLPAMATVHTSLYPTEHGAIRRHLAINKNLHTLAEQMKNNNYKTMGITTHSFVDSNHGFAQGFDIFDERNHRGVDDSSAERITQKAMKLIRENKGNKFFLWIHYFDPHSAYLDHQEYSYAQKPPGKLSHTINTSTLNNMIDDLNQEDVEFISDLYDEEVSYTDYSIGWVLDAVDELGLMDNTVIILTADHGEELMERARFGHGINTYDELIRVPLIIYNPYEKNLGGLRVRHSVETRKIAKTVLEISGIDNSHFGGHNLLDVARDNGDTATYLAFSEGSSARSTGTVNHAVIGDGWKLIRNLRDDTFELYDLESDPGEKINLIDSEGPAIEIMRNKLTSGLSEFKKERLVELERVKFTKEEIDELKALGYMQ
jgi:arylsulfatase A-like enzyme